jgi:hypothetical protein
MTDLDLNIARFKWADRRQKLVQKMKSVANRFGDSRMQRELAETAVRLSKQAVKSPKGVGPPPDERFS